MSEANQSTAERIEKDNLNEWEYEINKLRRDFDKFQNNIIDDLMKVRGEIASVRASYNRNGALIKGFTVKELVTLRQLGMLPKDLLKGDNSLNDGTETQKERQSVINSVPKV